ANLWVTGTQSPELYQTWRSGSFTYQFAVANGPYWVTLKLAEPTYTGAGQRQFGLVLNGQTVTGVTLDPFLMAGGQGKAIDKAFKVNVTGGQLTIGFAAQVGEPIVHGIQIVSVPAPDPTVLRVNAGGPNYVDGLG